jgi:hypothetical protein
MIHNKNIILYIIYISCEHCMQCAYWKCAIKYKYENITALIILKRTVCLCAFESISYASVDYIYMNIYM